MSKKRRKSLPKARCVKRLPLKVGFRVLWERHPTAPPGAFLLKEELDSATFTCLVAAVQLTMYSAGLQYTPFPLTARRGTPFPPTGSSLLMHLPPQRIWIKTCMQLSAIAPRLQDFFRPSIDHHLERQWRRRYGTLRLNISSTGDHPDDVCPKT